MNESVNTFRPNTSMSKQNGKYIGFGIAKDSISNRTNTQSPKKVIERLFDHGEKYKKRRMVNE
jgi:hypothetical protein